MSSHEDLTGPTAKNTSAAGSSTVPAAGSHLQATFGLPTDLQGVMECTALWFSKRSTEKRSMTFNSDPTITDGGKALTARSNRDLVSAMKVLSGSLLWNMRNSRKGMPQAWRSEGTDVRLLPGATAFAPTKVEYLDTKNGDPKSLHMRGHIEWMPASPGSEDCDIIKMSFYGVPPEEVRDVGDRDSDDTDGDAATN